MGERTILVGVGMMGRGAVNAMMRQNRPGEDVFPMLFAVSETECSGQETEPDFVFSRVCSLGNIIESGDLLKAWRPRDERADRYLRLKSGCASWNRGVPSSSRNLAAMMFAGFCAFGGRELLDAEIDRIAEGCEGCSVYMVASLSDGTGSGVFLPLSLYIARALHARGIRAKFRALLVMPRDTDSYESDIEKISPYVNFHKALYELNEVMSGCPGDEFFLGAPDDGVTDRLYPMDAEWTADAGLFGHVFFTNQPQAGGSTETVLANELWSLLTGVFDGIVQDSKGDRCCFLAASAVEFPIEFAAECISEKIALEREKKWFGMDVRPTEQNVDDVAPRGVSTAQFTPAWVDEYLDRIEALAGGESETYGLFADEMAQLLQGELCRRPFEGKKRRQNKQACLAGLVEQCRGKLKVISDECKKRFVDDVMAVRGCFLSSENRNEGENNVALAKTLQFEAWDFMASLARLKMLMSGVERRLEMMMYGVPALIRGENTADYLARVSALPLPDVLKTAEWEMASLHGVNPKDCARLAGLLKDAAPKMTEIWKNRRAAATLTLLLVSLNRMKTAMERLISEGRSMVENGEREYADFFHARNDFTWDTIYVGADSETIAEMCKAARKELSGFEPGRDITAVKKLLCDAGDPERLTSLSVDFREVLRRSAADELRRLRDAWWGTEIWRGLRRGGVVTMAGDARRVAEAVSMAEYVARPRVDMYTKPGSPERLCYASFALFSPETAEYIERTSDRADGGDGTDVKAALETFLQRGGCSESVAVISDGLAPGRVVCVSCADGIQMSAMTDISETSSHAAWYHRYRRLLEHLDECDLWMAFGYAVFGGKRADPPGFEPKIGSEEKLC